jgi:hypothetical protein
MLARSGFKGLQLRSGDDLNPQITQIGAEEKKG